MNTRHLVELARRLTKLERQVRTLSLPSLGYSSVDDGAVQFYDSTAGGTLDPGSNEGQLAAVVGTQFDGAVTVSSVTGPTPPTPSAPLLESTLGGLKVRWDGLFADAAFAPTDWSRLEVHASDDEAQVGDVSFDTLYATIESPRGGDVQIRLPYATHWVWFIARSQSGKASTASAAASAVPSNELSIYEQPGSDVPTGSVGTDGSGNFTRVSVTGEDSDGNGIPDSGLVIYGREIVDWFEDLPKGIVAYDNFGSDRGPYNAETGYGELGALIFPGREYRLNLRTTVENTVAGGAVAVRVRYTVSPDADTPAPVPTVTSPQILASQAAGPGAAVDFAIADHTIFESGYATPRNVRFLITGEPTVVAASSMWFRAYGNGSGLLSGDALGGTVISIEDVGRSVQQAGSYNLGDGTTTVPAPIRRQKTYTATAVRTYNPTGVVASTTYMVQGTDSANGNRRGLAIFPDMLPDLNGAIIEKIEVYLYADLWPQAPGTARVTTHAYTAAPASGLPAMTYRLESTKWPSPGGRWIVLPTSLHASFQNGAIRGIGVGPAPSDNRVYLGRFVGTGANAPKIRVTYVK